MKSVGCLLSVALLSLSTMVFAQSKPQEASGQSEMHKPMEKPAPTEAQKSFETMKTFAGDWEGPVTVNPLMPGMTDQPIKPLHLSMRVTSRGNTVIHEFQEANTPLDPNKYDHPVTTLYLDGDQLNLVHYCDAGNRPRMIGKMSPDGKTVEFELVDVSGSMKHGHMAHAVFTYIDANHHSEDWTYMLPGDKPIHAHMDLKRTN